MTRSLSNLVDNLTERIHKIKCKDCSFFLEYESVNANLMKCKCYCYFVITIIQIRLIQN